MEPLSPAEWFTQIGIYLAIQSSIAGFVFVGMIGFKAMIDGKMEKSPKRANIKFWVAQTMGPAAAAIVHWMGGLHISGTPVMASWVAAIFFGICASWAAMAGYSFKKGKIVKTGTGG